MKRIWDNFETNKTQLRHSFDKTLTQFLNCFVKTFGQHSDYLNWLLAAYSFFLARFNIQRSCCWGKLVHISGGPGDITAVIFWNHANILIVNFLPISWSTQLLALQWELILHDIRQGQWQRQQRLLSPVIYAIYLSWIFSLSSPSGPKTLLTMSAGGAQGRRSSSRLFERRSSWYF